MDPKEQQRRLAVTTMHETAAALERSEAVLHDSAEASPDEETRRRLHELGDSVTRQAEDIERRAQLVDGQGTTQATGAVSAAE